MNRLSMNLTYNLFEFTLYTKKNTGSNHIEAKCLLYNIIFLMIITKRNDVCHTEFKNKFDIQYTDDFYLLLI